MRATRSGVPVDLFEACAKVEVYGGFGGISDEAVTVVMLDAQGRELVVREFSHEDRAFDLLDEWDRAMQALEKRHGGSHD